MAALPSDIHIRTETPDDYAAVADVHRRAFGRENEAQFVARVRQSPGYDCALSLVAEQGGVIVGHILLSAIIIRARKRTTPAISLAPVAVRPEFQRRGVGTALVEAGLEACRQRGHRIVIVLGHPAYYPRFGFARADLCGILAPFEVPPEAFMVCALVPGALAGVTGTVEYPPTFDCV